MAETQSNLKIAKPSTQDTVESRDIPFLYNAQFFVLAFLCSLPLLHFGGERLFGIGTICLLTVYIFHVTFHDTRSSVIVFALCVAVMQLAILYSIIGPLLWQSFFNIIFLLIYNVFIVLTAGLGLLQFEVFRRDEVKFCANVEYFLFLLYPPCSVLILMWLISIAFGAYLAPYLVIIIGFPMCHTFLDPKLKSSFTTQHDSVLGQPEKMLALFNFVFAPSFVYIVVNVFNLGHYSSWISVFFCVCVPLFLITLLDTTDLRDMADIRNLQWQTFQVFTGCSSLIFGTMIVYIHDIVNGMNAVFLVVILLCSTTLFVTVKHGFSKLASSVACGLLLISYIAWLATLPWNLVFSIGTEIGLSFFTVELLVSFLAILSVISLAVSLSVRYRSWLNQVFMLYSFGFVVLEIVLMDSEVYSPYLMILTSFLVLYLVQRLYQVERLDKTPAVTSISLHACKILFMFTSLNARTSRSVLSRIFLISGGFSLCFTVTNIWLFEREKRLEKNKIVRYTGVVFVSSVVLSSTFLRTLGALLTHDNPSTADIVGLIFILSGICFIKLAFFHSDEQVARKQSVVVIVIGILITLLQPYFNIFQIVMQIPKLILREMYYETWHVVYAEYIILSWGLLMSLFWIILLLLKLVSIKEFSLNSLSVISVVIGAPLGLCIAHWVLPYPQVPSSILSIPYMISATITTNSQLLALKTSTTTISVRMYIVFLSISILSVVAEISYKIHISVLQSDIYPSVLYQTFLHLIVIIQGQPKTDLQISLDNKSSMFQSVAHNISVLLLFVSGLTFAPKDYYDVLLVPVCGLLVLLRINDFGGVKSKDYILKRVIFSGFLGLILYYRVVQQFPWSKWSFWTVIAFLLEVSIILCSLLVYLLTLSVFWHESVTPDEGMALAVFAPIFILMLFYGRTTAGQVLGLVGPALAYSAFYYPSR